MSATWRNLNAGRAAGVGRKVVVDLEAGRTSAVGIAEVGELLASLR